MGADEKEGEKGKGPRVMNRDEIRSLMLSILQSQKLKSEMIRQVKRNTRKRTDRWAVKGRRSD